MGGVAAAVVLFVALRESEPKPFVPASTSRYKWDEVARNRPPGCPWDLEGCQSVEDTVRRLWRADCTLEVPELQAAFDRVLHVTEYIDLVEVQPRAMEAEAATPRWGAVFKFADGTSMLCAAPYLEPQQKSGWSRIFAAQPANLFACAPPNLRQVYSLFDG